MHLNLLDDVHAVLAVNHIHCKAPFAKASGAADPVEVRLIVGVPIEVHREVKVHHECHLFHIDSCKQSSAKLPVQYRDGKSSVALHSNGLQMYSDTSKQEVEVVC